MGIRHQGLECMAVLLYAVYPRILIAKELVMFLDGGMKKRQSIAKMTVEPLNNCITRRYWVKG